MRKSVELTRSTLSAIQTTTHWINLIAEKDIYPICCDVEWDESGGQEETKKYTVQLCYSPPSAMGGARYFVFTFELRKTAGGPWNTIEGSEVAYSDYRGNPDPLKFTIGSLGQLSGDIYGERMLRSIANRLK